MIHGYSPPNGTIHISQLLFADNILLFSINDSGSLQNLRFVVNSFEATSDLKINLQKSSLAGVNTDPLSIQNAINIWNCSASPLPFDYLGMPLGGNTKSMNFWDPIIESIDHKLSSWQHSYISKGGRLTLIQAVLSNLPTYYLSLFKALMSVFKIIEKKMRNFLWEGAKDKGKSHLVRWDLIIKPKDAGGLGIDKVNMVNDALIGKWIWRYHKEPHHLWRRLIDSKYTAHLPGSTPFIYKYISSKSHWFNIVKLENTVGRHMERRVRNGADTYFWYHNWTNGNPLYLQYPRFFQLAADPLISVRDAWNPACSSWNPFFKCPLFSREVHSWATLSSTWQNATSNSGQDIIFWAQESNGFFSIKSIKISLFGGLIFVAPLEIGHL